MYTFRKKVYYDKLNRNPNTWSEKMKQFPMRLLALCLCLMSTTTFADAETKLLVRSDDIGSFHAANIACIKTYTHGIARSLEVMVPTPWFNEAVDMLNQHPGLDVGVHLTLTSEWDKYKWKPLTGARSFVDALGNFLPMTSQPKNVPPGSGFIQSGYDLNEVEAELRKQIEIAKNQINNVSHLTAHMGTATCMPDLRKLTYKLAQEYNLPIQFPNLKRAPKGKNWKTLDFKEREQCFIDMLDKMTPGTYLFVEHPGLDIAEMKPIGHKGYETVAKDRDLVTRVFTSPRVKQAIKQHGIELIGYDDLIQTQN